jgi:hypothetical protein
LKYLCYTFCIAKKIELKGEIEMKRNAIFFMVSVFAFFVIGYSSFAQTTVPKGYINGAYVKYYNSTTITVTSGNGDCNGNYWEITADTNVDLTGTLSTAESFVYIYIEGDSDFPDADISGSTAAPSWSNSKQGWYDGINRCIGVVWVKSANSVANFQNNSQLEYIYGNGNYYETILENGNPDGTYTYVAASSYTPVNATAVYLWGSNSDADGNVVVQVASYDNIISRLICYSKNTTAIVYGWIPFHRGASRDLAWFGENNDDNYFSIYIYGFRIER